MDGKDNLLKLYRRRQEEAERKGDVILSAYYLMQIIELKNEVQS